MRDLKALAEIREESKKRMKELSFGDKVTNICAGSDNPMFHCFFVEYRINSRENKFGLINRDYLARCTDKKKKFWDIDIEVIYPGWLTREESDRLYDPIHEAHFYRG